MNAVQGQVTRLLAGVQNGDAQAADQLLPLVYEELRRLAHARLSGERGVVTLPATALVHEAFLRLAGEGQGWENRGHFFAAAAEAMRRITIEYARAARRQKRGGDYQRITLDTLEGADAGPDAALLDLDSALTRLEAQDRSMAQVVKLRYFAGLTVEETAAALGLSPRSVNRQWTAARAWLNRALAD